MKSVPIAEFKAHCLELLREIQRTGNPIVITKSGRTGCPRFTPK